MLPHNSTCVHCSAVFQTPPCWYTIRWRKTTINPGRTNSAQLHVSTMIQDTVLWLHHVQLALITQFKDLALWRTITKLGMRVLMSDMSEYHVECDSLLFEGCTYWCTCIAEVPLTSVRSTLSLEYLSKDVVTVPTFCPTVLRLFSRFDLVRETKGRGSMSNTEVRLQM